MKKAGWCAGALAGAVLAAAALLHAQDKPPVDPAKFRKMCLKCHDKFEQSLAGKKLHAPVEQGKCVACHNPHASDDRHFLDDAETRLCVACHAGYEAVLAKKYVHTPLRNGKCSPCHEPHASNEKAMLREGAAKLCASCHNQKEKFGREFVHAPVARGECLTCHDPHASDEPAELKKAGAALCLSCHKDAEALGRSHGRVAVDKSGCVRCHDPHSSVSKAMLKAVVHYPAQQRECGACHDPAGPGGLKKAVPELCLNCHPKDKLVGASVHKPVSEGKCLVCHDSHASDEKGLLVRRKKDLCFSCHPAVAAAERRKVLHAPFREGDCSKCHGSHVGAKKGMIRDEGEIALCRSCHKQTEGHPVGIKPSKKIEVVAGSRVRLDADGMVTCSSCHDPHGAELGKILLYDKDRELCIQCHKGM